jgi:hypothetical protein
MRKNKREPIRCAKCQRYGHMAKECLSHKDTCANCAEEHRTSDCSNKNRTCCISCESEDHASWNRNCPEFERCCTDTDSRYPENTMPYYPTDDIWTQVQAPPKAKPYVKTSLAQQVPSQQTQGMLGRHLAPRGRGGGTMRGRVSPNPRPSTPRPPSNQNTSSIWETPDSTPNAPPNV